MVAHRRLVAASQAEACDNLFAAGDVCAYPAIRTGQRVRIRNRKPWPAGSFFSGSQPLSTRFLHIYACPCPKAKLQTQSA